jgi:signal transduction histidine kinase
MSAPRSRGRILLRIYLHSLLLLVLAGVAIDLVMSRFVAPSVTSMIDATTAEIVEQVMADRAEAPRLQRDLERLRARVYMAVTLYDAGGALLGSNVEPPFPPVPLAEIARLSTLDRRVTLHEPHLLVTILEEGRFVGYAIVDPPRPGSPIRPAMVVLGIVLFALAVGSIPLARSIAAPIMRLSAVARAFGAGDTTARARLQRSDEIGDLARTFDEMADRVTTLLKAEKELVANVSHELRTPLSRIRVVLEMASERDAARVRRYLAEIAEDLAELERLVDDVLAMARLDLGQGRPGDAGPLSLRAEPTDPAKLCADAASRFERRFPRRALTVSIEDDLPRIHADPTMLRRVVDNLLDNARKYSDDKAPIELSVAAEGSEVVFSVKDRGIGIEPADRSRLFTPFFRTDRSRARSSGGVGLGLALARQIVEAHGGRIAIESEPGAGTEVRFHVPAAR